MARWHSRPYCVGAVDGTFPWARVSTGGAGNIHNFSKADNDVLKPPNSYHVIAFLLREIGQACLDFEGGSAMHGIHNTRGKTG